MTIGRSFENHSGNRGWCCAERAAVGGRLECPQLLSGSKAEGDEAAATCAVIHVLIVGRAAPDDVSADASAFGNGLARRCEMTIQKRAAIIRIDGDDVALLRA